MGCLQPWRVFRVKVCHGAAVDAIGGFSTALRLWLSNFVSGIAPTGLLKLAPPDCRERKLLKAGRSMCICLARFNVPPAVA